MRLSNLLILLSTAIAFIPISSAAHRIPLHPHRRHSPPRRIDRDLRPADEVESGRRDLIALGPLDRRQGNTACTLGAWQCSGQILQRELGIQAYPDDYPN